MNGAVNASTAKQAGVGGIDNGISRFIGDVTRHQFQGGLVADPVSQSLRHCLSIYR
jgi:hypothetical protein